MQHEPIIAFDESGNTGSDLLDKDQPVFVLASVKLTLGQATELKKIIKTNAGELKFNRLKKYHKYHSQIVSLLNSEIISEETVKLALFHKEYCIWVHTVDRLIEPLAYRDGFDFYKGGLNLAFTNLLFYCTPVFCDKTIYEQYKRDFIDLFYKRDAQSINQFYTTVQSLITSCKNEEYITSLSPILASYEIIESILDDWDTNNFDSTLSGFINLIDYWGRKTDKTFYAHVDNSKALNHFKYLVDKVKSIYIKQQEIGTDRRTLQLPLKLIDIKFVDSKDNIVVQIADLIAGAANHYHRAVINEKFRDDLSDKIGETKIVELLHSPVWPHKAFTSEDLHIVDTGRPNVIDSMTQFL
jgi:hypothetical protein